MNKPAITTWAVIGLVAIAWLGSSWVIGGKIRDVTHTQTVLANQEMQRYRLAFRIEDYRRGMLSSSYRSCVAFEAGEAAMPVNICFLNRISHGPLVRAGAGLRAGLAGFDTRLDLSPLPEEVQAQIAQLFAGQPPLSISGYMDLAADSFLTVAVAPFRMDSPLGSGHLQLLQLDMEVDANLVLRSSTLELKDLMVDAMGSSFALKRASSQTTITGLLAQTLPLYQSTTAFEGMALAMPGYAFKGDMHVQVDTREQAGLLSSDVRLWLENLDIKDVPVRKGYLGVAVSGVDGVAMLRIYELIDQINNELSDGLEKAMAQERPDMEAMMVAQQRMVEVTSDIMKLVTGPLLRAGSSSLALQLVLEDEQPIVSGGMKTVYQGGLSPEMTAESLAALTAEQMLAWLDTELRVDWRDELLPPHVREALEGAAEAGMVEQHGQHWRLAVTTHQGEVRLNGASRTLEELALLMAMVMPSPAADPYDDDGESDSHPRWYSEHDRFDSINEAVSQAAWYLDEYHQQFKSFSDAGTDELAGLLEEVQWSLDRRSGELLIELPEAFPFRRRAVKMTPQWFERDDTVYWNCLVVGGDAEELGGCEFATDVRPQDVPAVHGG
ncbi:MAG: DUF945 family protein [Alcanivoracaceae bacterium]